MVDYSKWANIEVSDDEDDTHPNIDTPSLFHWRHQAWLERMKEHKEEVENFENKKTDHDKKISETKEKLSEVQSNNSENLVALQETLKELEKEGEDLKQQNKKEKNTPWNVDTISRPGFSKAMINTGPPRPTDENLTEKESRKKKIIKHHEKELKHYEMKKIDHEKKMSVANEKLSDAQLNNSGNLVALQEALKELEEEGEDLKQMEEELKKKNNPWNIDTISKPGFSKTMINTRPRPADKNLTEKERKNRKEKFIKEHGKELEHYGMLRNYDDSRAYLKAHDYLVCEDTIDYLDNWCINLEIEQKPDLRENVLHQSVCMQGILGLAEESHCEPTAYLDIFFAKIQGLKPEKQARFKGRLRIFNEEVILIARAKRVMEEDERQRKLGPNGLDEDPDVSESLPDELEKCDEGKNTALPPN